MIVRHKIFSLIILILVCEVHSEDVETKDDLMESESKDPSKVDIIKQIKRVNDDGSYTFGYEAEDGTFKIESRDVLGNVKGTFGFVDTDGEIKRVSYSTTNSTESATVLPEKERSSVIQTIPRNRTVSTTRRPLVFPHVTPSPSSTVIQAIPRRRVLSSSNSTTTTTTERPSYKNIVKSSDFENPTTRSSLPDSAVIRSLSNHQARPAGHYIRSTLSPQSEQRFTEGQLVRPTQSDTVTPHPTENSYSRRLIVTRNPYLDETVSSTIKPIEESSFNDNVRGNLLRRQLSQEKVTNFDARQHVLSLQQSVGDDSTDVYSASLTTGTPRPLFTTTDRSRSFPTSTTPKPIIPAKYQTAYQKNLIRRPSPQEVFVQESTTDATVTENNYVAPNPIQVHQLNEEQAIPLIRSRHPFHRGAILIPVNQLQNGRYVIDDSSEDGSQQPYAVPVDQQYVRDRGQYVQQQNPDPRYAPVPLIIRGRRPVAIPIPIQDYQRQPDKLFTPGPGPYPVPLPVNPAEFQDEIDNIKPPVSTHDFQKLLNRLIIRQSQLQEISRIENAKMATYYSQDRYRNAVQPTPVSVFVRAHPDARQHGPVQFISQPQNQRQRSYITIPQSRVPMQKIMESQQQYNTADPFHPENYAPAPHYRTGRRVGRVPSQNSLNKQEENDNYLPPDVREMLLLRMLQLAINPNLPLPQNEGESMTRAIREYKKTPIRNVEILGEEKEEERPRSRNKRFRESDEYEYY